MKSLCIALALVGFLSILSCEKDEISYSNVVGYWKGKIGIGTADPDSDIGVLFRNDGTLRVYSNSNDTTNANKVDDIYAVGNNVINMGYIEFGTPYNRNMEGIINSGFTGIDGTWGAGAAVTGGGTFYLTR
jgi:hypothetical protein